MGTIMKATHMGQITIGDIKLDCAVLEDGTRVLSQRAVTKALGGKRGGSHWRRMKNNPEGAMLPVYLSASNLSDFIDESLRGYLENPKEYKIPGKSGATPAQGLEAGFLPAVCNVYLKARDAGALHPSQIHLALQADSLIRGLAHVGIIALIDEATGYQRDRDKDALAKLLEKYLSEERLRWAKMFPDEFYRQMYRLMKWEWPSGVKGKPLYVGKLTNKLVYERLPIGVLEELKARNPIVPIKKRRAYTYTQFLSEDFGQPDLRDHLMLTISFMKVARSMKHLMEMMDQVLPKGREVPLMLEY